MTKKDYKAIALALNVSTFKDNSLIISKPLLLNELCYIMKRDNPRFDEEKFRSACGICL